MDDAKYHRLHDAYDVLFPAKLPGRRDGKKVTKEVPQRRAHRQEEGPADRAGRPVFPPARYLSHCESESTVYMVRGELWQRALAGTYQTGLLCLRCLVKRLAPQQLFAEDLSNGTDGAGSTPCSNDWKWTDPASGATFQMTYQITFPSREGPPELRCTMYFSSDGDDPPDAFCDACDDRVAWLRDYCREHRLDLVLNDDTVLRRSEDVEDESALTPAKAQSSRS